MNNNTQIVKGRTGKEKISFIIGLLSFMFSLWPTILEIAGTFPQLNTNLTLDAIASSITLFWLALPIYASVGIVIGLKEAKSSQKSLAIIGVSLSFIALCIWFYIMSKDLANASF